MSSMVQVSKLHESIEWMNFPGQALWGRASLNTYVNRVWSHLPEVSIAYNRPPGHSQEPQPCNAHLLFDTLPFARSHQKYTQHLLHQLHGDTRAEGMRSHFHSRRMATRLIARWPRIELISFG